MESKVCTKCKVSKPLDNFYLRADHIRRESACKACKNKAAALKRQAKTQL